MSACPYTYIKKLFKITSNDTDFISTTEQIAKYLRVRVIKNQVTTVDVFLPAQSANWLIDLIPEHIVNKIREENIPLELIQENIKKQKVKYQQIIFKLIDQEKNILVWLE